ncbi:MAG: branched-chain amino acid ABC transporter permease [Eubacteriaceae bacterium]|nr:branched-chain amino acid ABC transporter permease [Eubacteriaceae bacterium]
MFTFWEIVLQQFINGLVLGSFYALVALGYSMVYGIIKLLNFAHGDIYMAGAFTCLSVYSLISGYMPGWLGISLAMLAAILASAILGYIAQRVAYRPLLSAPRLSLLISAIGVSLVIYNAVMVMTNSKAMFFPGGINKSTGISYGHVTITYMQISLLAAAFAAMAALTVFISRTKLGKAMRAIAIDTDACYLMGINVNAVISFTFMLGSGLAAVAGGMYCVYYGNVQYSMGYLVGIKAFTSSVIGGIGSIPGAMLGGLLLGLLEAFGTQMLGSSWKDVFAFSLLILILAFKPNGLLGKPEVARM